MWRKNKYLLLFCSLGVIFCVFSLLSSTANASTGVNPAISFEGKIVNSSGVNIANGNYDVEFTMYTGCTNEPASNASCTLVWTEDYINGNALGYLAFNGGTFQANVGQLCPWSGSTCQGNTNTGFNWNTYPIYMSMQIGGSAVCTPAGNFTANCGGDGVMQPYILMTSTPYAQNAGTLGNIAAAGFAQLAIGSQTFTGSNTFEDSASSTTAFQVENTSAQALLDLDNTTNSLNIGATGSLALGATVNINNSTAATGTTSIGSTNGASAVNINVGTGNFSLNGANTSTYAIGGNTTTGTILIGGTAQTGAGTLTVGSSTASNTENIGTGNGATTLNLGTGTGANIIQIGSTTSSSGTQTIGFGDNGTAGSTTNLTIGSTIAGTFSLQDATTINLNTPTAQFTALAAGTRTLNVATQGSNVAGTNLTVQAGAAGAGASAFTGGTLSLKGGNAGGTGNANGANVALQGGAGTGTGVQGLVTSTATAFTSVAYSTGVSAGITQADIDNDSTIGATATAGSLTLTVPSPTITTTGRILYLSNAGATNAFTVAATGLTSFTLNTASTATLLWNGSAWTSASYDAGSASYIQNQNAASQTANYRINGTGQAAAFDAAAAGVLNIGITTATSLQIGSATNTTGGVTISSASSLALATSSSAGNITFTTDNVASSIIAKSSVNTTTALSVQNSSSANILNVDTTNTQVDVGALSPPGTPVVTQAPLAGTATGSGSGTAYTYEITSVSANGTESLGATEADASNGATLSSNPINVNWTGNGASYYKIYRTASAGTPSTTGLVGEVSSTAVDTVVGGSETGTTLTLDFTEYPQLNWSVGQAISLSGVTMSSGSVTGTHEILSVNNIPNSTDSTITVFISGGVTSTVTNSVGTATGLLAFIDNGFTAGAAAPALATTGSLTANGVTPYYYEVTALDNSYTTGGSIGQTTVTSSTPQVVGTTNLVNTSLTISWAPVFGARGYIVYRSTTNGVYTTDSYYVVHTNSFTDTGAAGIGINTVPPTVSTAYGNNLSDNANSTITIGSNGTSSAQLYVGGQLPTTAIATIPILAGAFNVIIQGNYAYQITDNGLEIIDVSNPANPVVISTIAAGSINTSVAVEGNYAYVTDYFPYDLQIINISNPDAPVTVSTLSTPSLPDWVVVQGSYAYVTMTGSNTLEIIDISDPANPIAVGNVTTNSGGPYNAQIVNVQGNYAYVVNVGNGTLQIIDVSNPANPVTVGSVSDIDGGYVYVQGRYAYVTSLLSSSLQIIDVSNPTNPVIVGSASATSANDVYVQGNYAYVTSANSDQFQVFNISNPADPTSVGIITTPAQTGDIYVQGRYAYVVESGNNTLQVYDMGGAYIQQLQVGGTETGTLQVDSNANVSGSESVSGGLTVGSSAEVSGALGVNGNLTVSGLTQLGGITAINGVYGGYSSIGLATPSAPTVTFSGVVGTAATWSYEVEAVDAAGNTTAASSVGSITSSDDAFLGDYATLAVSSVTFATPHVTYNVGSGQPFVTNMTISVSYCSGTGADDGTYVITSETTSTIVVSNASGVAGETGCTIATEENDNVVSWTPVTGAVNYYVFRTADAAGGSPSTTGYIGSTSSTSLVDNGYAGAGTHLAQTTDSTNSFIVKTATNSGIAFDVQSSAGANILNVDTSNAQVDIGALSAPSTITATLAPTISNTTTFGTAGGTTYTYEVVAAGPNGSFTYPSPASANTAFGNPTLSGSNYNIVNWGAVTGATNYYVYRTVSGGTPSSTGLIGVVSGTTSLHDTGLVATGASPALTGGLTNSQGYYFKVTALDSTGGQTTASAETTPVTTATTGTNLAISLSWAPVNGARGYNVYYATSSGAETNGYFTTSTNSYEFTTTTGTTAGSIPTFSSAYGNTLSDNANSDVSIGSNGTDAGQLYVGGSVPTSAISTIATGGGPYTAQVQGNYAYIANIVSSTLQIVDVSNPANPVIVGTISTNSGPSSAYVQGDYVYVTNYGSGTIQIINVSNPVSPFIVSTTAAGTYPDWVSVQGNYAYVSEVGTNVLQIFNVSNPANPVSVGSLAINSNGPLSIERFYVQGNYAYMANQGNGALQIINISNPASPVSVSSIVFGGTPESVFVQGHYAYVALGYGNNLEIVDVSNPANPVLVNTISDTGAYYTYVQGNYLYVTSQLSYLLQVYDITNPANPQLVNSVSTGSSSYPSFVQVVGRYAYVANNQSSTFQIFDMGGAYIQQLQAGGIETTTLQVDNNAEISGSESITGGLQVSSSAEVSGALGVNGALTVSGLTQLAGGTAINGVYGGYSSVGLAPPSAPSVTFSGTTGSAATWSYEIEAVNAAGNTTAASPAGSITTGDTDGLGNYLTQATTGATTFATGHVTYPVNSGQPFLTGMAITVNSCNGTGADNSPPSYTITSETTNTVVVSNASGVAGETGCVIAEENNANTISWSAVTGAVKYYVFRTVDAAGGSPSTTGYIGSTSSTSLIDIANAGTATYLVQSTDSTNNFSIQTATNSTTAFQVENSSAASLFNVDTTDTVVGIGTSGTAAALLSVGGTTGNFRVNAAGTTTIAAGQSYTGLGAVTLSSAAATALTLTGNAASTWSTSSGAITISSGSGNIILQPAGSGTTANVQIGAGNGGGGSTTPDLLVLDDLSTGTPTEVNGGMYYNATTHSYLCGDAGAWESCSGQLYSNTAASSEDVSCTALCAAVGIAPIPANYCQAGKVIHIVANGTYQDTTVAPTLSFGFYYGTNAAKASDTLIGAASPVSSEVAVSTTQPWSINYTIICYSTTSMDGAGTITIETSTTTTTTNLMNQFVSTTTSGLTTTSAANLYLFPAIGTSNAANGVTLNQYVVTGSN